MDLGSRYSGPLASNSLIEVLII